MSEKQLWDAYLLEHPIHKEETYQAWCYGGDIPDTLAMLTATKVKTATASAYPFYEYENCELPKVGEHNIILDTKKNALCIIKTTCVTVIPFLQVSTEHAYKEGEGDRSLAYWRNVHETFFTDELIAINQEFTEDMLVVCEEFEVVFLSKDFII